MPSEAVPPSETGDDTVVYAGVEVGVVIAHVGATESYVTVIASPPAFPAASLARTVMTLFPGVSATEKTLQLVVPDAVPEAPVAAFVHATVVTPTLSDALPPSETDPEAVAYAGVEVGEVIVHVGAAES
jgi:hypothetical protein